jgi:hypothetical protein
MTGRCFNCSSWITCRKVIFDGDGQEVITWNTSDGNGKCGVLNFETPPEFGCVSYSPGTSNVSVTHKPGFVWEHFEYRPCPDCGGRGSTPEAGMCQRCYGTARVRFYDDGYIGEERTRLHPKEREALCTEQQPPNPLEMPNPGMALKPRPDPFAAQATP